MSLAASDFEVVQRLVRQRSAIVLESGKEYLAEARLLPLVRKAGLASLSDLVGCLRTQPYGGLHKQVVEAMTTNETSFFRDIHPFEALRKKILPDLIARNAATRTLNIWCGASSTGQEPYSVCMLIREHFPALARWRVKFIATDLSTEVLERARAGRYSQLEVNRGLPAALMVKYFTRSGADWYIRDELRNMMEFSEMNLAETWPVMPQLDLVMLRNVLIYFDVETKKTILRKIRRAMHPRGYLLLGGSETTINFDEHMERVQIERVTCCRPAPQRTI